MASHFDVKRQWGFATIAMICFFLLDLPLVTLVIFAFTAGSLRRCWGAGGGGEARTGRMQAFQKDRKAQVWQQMSL